MFCSKCGKSLENDAVVCPACGAGVGENRFGGAEDYTAAQFTIAPGQKEFAPIKPYTRTTYTDMPDANQDEEPVSARTTYRPALGVTDVTGDMRRSMKETIKSLKSGRAGTAAAADEPEADPKAAPEAEDVVETAKKEVQLSEESRRMMDEFEQEIRSIEPEVDRESLRPREIRLSNDRGISDDVNAYIRRMEDEQKNKKKTERRRATPVYDDLADDEVSQPGSRRRAESVRSGRSQAVSEEDYYEEEEEDEARQGGSVANIIKIAVAVVVAAMLAFGVIRWIGYIRSKQDTAPIEGVTGSYYDAGLALIKTYAEDDFIDSRKALYITDGMVTLNNQLGKDVEQIKALMPEEQAANDSTFEAALLKIQENVGNSIIMEGLAGNDIDAAKREELNGFRDIVRDSITSLENARSAAELTAIINGQTIDVVTETPVPTAVPVNYDTLSKGSAGNNVLKLQNRLYELGFLKGDRDGEFGSKTQTAVKLFQEKAGIEASGIADAATQERLYADDAPSADGSKPAASTEQPAATPAPVEEAEPVPELEGGEEI